MSTYEIGDKVKMKVDILELEYPLLQGEVVTIVNKFLTNEEEFVYEVEYANRENGNIETINVYTSEIVSLNQPLFHLWDIVQVSKTPFMPEYRLPIEIGDVGVIIKIENSDRGVKNRVLLNEKEGTVWDFYDDEIILMQQRRSIEIDDTVRVIKIDTEKDADYLINLGVKVGHMGVVEDIFESSDDEEETIYLVSLRIMPNEPRYTVELYESEIEKVE